MSDVLERPRTRPRNGATRAAAEGRVAAVASVWVRGAFAAAWSFAVGLAALLVLALIVWAADSRSQAHAGDAMRLAAQLWLLGHRTPLRIAGGTLTIPPMCVTGLLVLLIARASSMVARSSTCEDARDVGIIVASVTLPYSIFATVLAAFSASTTFHPEVGAAFICAALLSGAASTAGTIRGAGLGRTAWAQVSPRLRAATAAAASAAGVLLAAATLLLAGALVAHSAQIGAILREYHGGPAAFAMLLLSVFMLPNAVCFALAYLLGPGFALGAGTAVHLGSVHLAATPSLPLLASAPTGPAPWPVLALCLFAVVAAGALAGWRIARMPVRQLKERLITALTSAVILGVGAAVLVGFAGGPAGPGRLHTVGPSPWQVGLSVTGEMALVSCLVVAFATWLQPAVKVNRTRR